MKERTQPCLCVSCPECDAVFKASALNEQYHCDDQSNRELLNEVTDYARQGYNVSVKDVSEFSFKRCEHLK